MPLHLYVRRAIFFAIAVLTVGAAGAEPAPQPTYGWASDYIGAGRGDVSVSLGAMFWKDYFRIRNLIARGTIELAPGIRAHAIVRRREGSWDRMPLHPDVDEAYGEAFRFFRQPDYSLAFNLKVGRARYLHFPEPDYLAYFDQVPGIADLTGGPVTDYRGLICAFEGAHRSGLGVHATAITWAFDADQRGTNAVEWYGFYRHAFPGGWRAEARLGALAERREPLGRPARRGGSIFVGKQIGEFEVGGMVEDRRTSPTYTGVMVRFRPTDVTKALGTVGFDYDRRPEGVALQYDLLHVRIDEGRVAGPDEELVGEVQAERLRTYWQSGFERNEYEHRLSSWGVTGGPGVRAVVEEQPWYLQLEALVSPHTSVNRQWFADRQGPAQLAQEVTYRFYRKRGAGH